MHTCMKYEHNKISYERRALVRLIRVYKIGDITYAAEFKRVTMCNRRNAHNCWSCVQRTGVSDYKVRLCVAKTRGKPLLQKLI